ncbi:FAD-binding oxidoreductase [Streptomyces sp. NBC_01549]|uniref:FAD-dependent oxidoreductase n=1 Tax=Streptomyces sp. NBC_01549 TaxID=2975874 RepID=UPI002253DA62|nr:FAD-dependent oxidoreductase [Streptomyces sp. NBC_01549]MCX4594728.1 FAD-binding oxidoreductase [Streptomyces sp. NBC_01549]
MGDRFDAVVVGAGVIGLTTALRLQQAGARVAVVTAEPSAETTSSVAAAVWYPTRTRFEPRVLDWATRTYDEFARQAANGVPGVAMRPTRMLLRSQNHDAPWWAMALPDLRTLRGDEVRAPFSGGWAFTAPTVEMSRYLPWLQQTFSAAGGTLIHRRIDALEQAGIWAPAVVNASGLGARALCGDTEVRPVRGQLVLVANPGLHTSVRDEDNAEGSTYVHPRSADIVLGGTFEIGKWDTTPSPVTAAAILRRCTELLPELADTQVLGHQVGLRPHRDGGVRLEADPRPHGRVRRLVHNYGHGGAGITLAWGCANAATALVAGAVRPG